MNRRILIFLAALLSTIPLVAQYSPCYEAAFAEGKRLYEAGKYAQAKNYFNEAKSCPDPNTIVVDEWIGKCEKAMTDKKNKPTNDLTISVNGISFVMKFVEGGTFYMGAQSDNPDEPNFDSEALVEEQPVHKVMLSSFYIGETEVTQALWLEVMGEDPGWEDKYGFGSNYPAYRVSWEDCQEFIRKLNDRTGKKFRLPTEAEWEYAARGGNKSKGYRYAGGNNVDQVSWHQDNSEDIAHPVKLKKANELKLYDMSGNLWEWCSDWYDEYNKDSQSNPQGPLDGTIRVLRGGSWSDDFDYGLLPNRFFSAPGFAAYFIGVRLVLTQ